MKFTGALSSLLVVLPLVLLQASAAPAPAPEPFNFQGIASKAASFLGGKDKNGGATSTAAAASSTAAAGAANSTASTGASNTASAANGTAAAAGGNPQTSLTLDPSVIGSNIAQDGQAVQEAGQVPSETSTNNFINSCIGKTITNGVQVATGSCNPIPMGDIPAKQNQPAAKFVSPPNLSNIAAANTAFDVVLGIQGMQTGFFTNPNTNYFGAPQQLNSAGQIQGHSHAVIQAMTSITSSTILDAQTFDFFQGINLPAQNGQLKITVAKGLPEGTYRMATINTAANHQPVLGPVAQHGSYDDVIYFTVGPAAGAAAASAVGGGAGAASNATAAAPPAAAPPAAAPPANAGNATAAAPPAASNATAAAPPAASGAAAGAGNNGNAKGKGKGKGKGGRRSIIARQY